MYSRNIAIAKMYIFYANVYVIEQWENDISKKVNNCIFNSCFVFVSDEVIKISIGSYTKLVGFSRAMCPCAVRDNLFRLITTQAGSLRAPPANRNFAVPFFMKIFFCLNITTAR